MGKIGMYLRNNTTAWQQRIQWSTDDDVPFGFDALIVILQMAQQRIVVRMENQPRQFAHYGENITRTGSIFASLKDSQIQIIFKMKWNENVNFKNEISTNKVNQIDL